MSSGHVITVSVRDSAAVLDQIAGLTSALPMLHQPMKVRFWMR